MSKQLSFLPLDNIGLDGLNLQSNPASLPSSWLTQAENIVLRESGRISFRKGLKQNILANTDGTAGAALKIGAIGASLEGLSIHEDHCNTYCVIEV